MLSKDRPKKLDFSLINQKKLPKNQIQETLNNIISITPDPSEENQVLIKKTPKHGTLEHEKWIHQIIEASSDPRKRRIVGLSKRKNNEIENHALYFPYLSGGNLEALQLADRLKKNSGGYAWLLNQITCLLETLDYLHTSTFYYHTKYCVGIVHDDIKPNNLLLDEKGDIYLADFGSAHPAEEKAKNSINTSYSPPEFLAHYFSAEDINMDRTKADIWRLGMTLHELMHGHKPKNLHLCTDIEQESLDRVIDAAKNYAHSPFAKRADQALLTLQNTAEKQIIDTPQSLLTLLCFVMLTPLGKRPSAKDLLTLIHVTSLHTTTTFQESAAFVKEFSSDDQKRSHASVTIKENKMAFFQPLYPLTSASSSCSTTEFSPAFTGGRTP